MKGKKSCKTEMKGGKTDGKKMPPWLNKGKDKPAKKGKK